MRPIIISDESRKKLFRKFDNKSITTRRTFTYSAGELERVNITEEMSHSVKRTLDFLILLAKIKNAKKRNLILKEISGDKVLFKALSEIAHNFMKGNIPLGSDKKKKLKRHRRVLKALDCPKSANCLSKRKKVIEQAGGILPILIPAAAAALGHLSGAIIRKVIK